MASSKVAPPLPGLSSSRPGTSSGFAARRNSLGQRRRVSLSVLPSPGECTTLPALSSVQSLLLEDAPTLQEYESQIQQISSQLESSSLSPTTKAAGGSQGLAWRVLVLGRTFRDHAEDYVIDCVAEVLLLDREEAVARVAKAKDKLMHVLDECASRKTAFERMEALRSRGLTVEVTSEQSLPGREKRKGAAGLRRHSFSSSTGFATTMAFTAADVQPPPGPSPGASLQQQRRRVSKEKWNSVDTNGSSGMAPADISPRKSLLCQAMAFEVRQAPADAVEALFQTEEQKKKERAEEEEKRAKQVQLCTSPEEKPLSSDEDDDGDELPEEVVEKILEHRRMTQIPRLKQLISKHRDELFPKKRQEKQVNDPTSPETSTLSPRKQSIAKWDNVLDMLEVNSTETSSVSPQRKEACDMMRFLCFGINWVLGMTHEGERLTSSQIEAFYVESIGTKEEVNMVLSVFHMLDCDRSGRVDQAEMQSACLPLMKQRFFELRRHIEQGKLAQLEALMKSDKAPSGRRPSTKGMPDASSGRRQSISGPCTSGGSGGENTAPREGRPEAPRRNVQIDAQDNPASPKTPRMPKPMGRQISGGSQAGKEAPDAGQGDPGSPKPRMTRRGSESMKPDMVAPQPVHSGGQSLPSWAQPLQNEDGLKPEKSAMRALEKLTGYLLGKKSSFTLEDMLRTIWMKAKRFEVNKMKDWCKQFIDEARNARVQTPPVLQQGELDGLKSVFKHYDAEGNGELSFEQLVTLGLIFEDQIDKCREEWDSDHNGVLDMQEFCQMMCPAGYRATRDSQIGTLKDGTRVKFDVVANLWRLENPDTSRLSMNGLKSE